MRKSQRGGDNQPYTLVVLYRGHVYNLKVRRRPDTQVALGEEKPDELVSFRKFIYHNGPKFCGQTGLGKHYRPRYKGAV